MFSWKAQTNKGQLLHCCRSTPRLNSTSAQQTNNPKSTERGARPRPRCTSTLRNTCHNCMSGIALFSVKVARELEEQTLDVAGLRQLLVLKNRELRNVRKLSQYILEQRNEVITMFLFSNRCPRSAERTYGKEIGKYNATQCIAHAHVTCVGYCCYDTRR